MKKSIESIWKEGFLNKDALVAPKLNDLYNQKSIHLIDQFKRRYRLNLRGLVIFAFFVLLISFPVGMQYMGVPIFFIFISLVFYSKKHLDSMDSIDKNSSSYLYLKAFHNWLKERISIFSKLYQYVYPLIFLSMVAGFWFLKIGDDATLGGSISNWFSKEFPSFYAANGLTIVGFILVISIMFLISYFSKSLYEKDFRALYGNLMDRLEELISDMEELNTEHNGRN